MNPRPIPLAPDIAAWIAAKIQGLRFGTVTLYVHDGKVIQIDKTEKEKAQ